VVSLKHPKARALKWGATILCVGFVAYILSLGPLAALERYGAFPRLAPAFEWYQEPADWLANIRPLHRLIESYIGFWLNITDAPDTTI
jgi:hypothetical protein